MSMEFCLSPNVTGGAFSRELFNIMFKEDLFICVWGGMHAYICAVTRKDVRCPPLLLSNFSFEAGSLHEPGAVVFSGCKPASAAILLSPNPLELGLQVQAWHPACCVSTGIQLGLYDFTATLRASVITLSPFV